MYGEAAPVPDWLHVSRETLDRLLAFAALVEKWNRSINLVARSTMVDLWDRHVLDSAQIVLLAPPTARTWLDLGSGGGFPGLVAAIMLAESPEKTAVTLVESDQRKAVFLREAARQLGLNVTVLAARIEDIPPVAADVVSARALAPLGRLLTYAHPHLKPGGVALFAKGNNHASEAREAQMAWTFDLTTFPSRTDPAAAVLKIENLRHA